MHIHQKNHLESLCICPRTTLLSQQTSQHLACGQVPWGSNTDPHTSRRGIVGSGWGANLAFPSMKPTLHCPSVVMASFCPVRNVREGIRLGSSNIRERLLNVWERNTVVMFSTFPTYLVFLLGVLCPSHDPRQRVLWVVLLPGWLLMWRSLMDNRGYWWWKVLYNRWMTCHNDLSITLNVKVS